MADKCIVCERDLEASVAVDFTYQKRPGRAHPGCLPIDHPGHRASRLEPPAKEIPSWDDFHLAQARGLIARVKCIGNEVGATIVIDNRQVAGGYNGTPSGMPNCTVEDHGCIRCSDPNREPGVGYDLCICVHAEQNALLQAARFGIAVDKATCYSTLRPCINCLKELLQAGIRRVVWAEDFRYSDTRYEEEYRRLLQFMKKRRDGLT